MCMKILPVIVSVASNPAGHDNQIGYLIGGLIALMILGYLAYTLLHPDKF
jgi:F subunit of K+-transporting ATPase (Potass_KdpF)